MKKKKIHYRIFLLNSIFQSFASFKFYRFACSNFNFSLVAGLIPVRAALSLIENLPNPNTSTVPLSLKYPLLYRIRIEHKLLRLFLNNRILQPIFQLNLFINNIRHLHVPPLIITTLFYHFYN